MKLTTIDETQDIGTIKVDERIGSFLTFEMTINDKYKNKNKGITFKYDVESDNEHVEEVTDDNLTNSIF